MNYAIKKIDDALQPPLTDKLWESVEKAPILFPWTDQYPLAPASFAQLCYNQKGIFIKHTTNEIPIASYTNLNDPVYLESCAEFFLQPNPSRDENYINFEINALGTPLIGYGPNRTRNQLTVNTACFHIQTEKMQNGWTLQWHIPFSFLLNYFQEIEPVLKGNLQKCCELPGKEHFGCWSPIGTEKPDFHQPSYFGQFTLEETSPL